MSKCIYCHENESGEYGYCDDCQKWATEPDDYEGDF